MDYTQKQQQQQEEEEDEVMEVPEIDDGDLLAELLDASFAAAADEEETGPQCGFTADVVVFDGCVVESRELNSVVHPHHDDCEDCGLDDDGGILSDFELDGGCGCSRSPSPSYVACDDDDTAHWTETGEAALGECMGGWYMGGMAMEWEEEENEGNDFSVGPYYYGGEVGAEQLYGSPLWE